MRLAIIFAAFGLAMAQEPVYNVPLLRQAILDHAETLPIWISLYADRVTAERLNQTIVADVAVCLREISPNPNAAAGNGGAETGARAAAPGSGCIDVARADAAREILRRLPQDAPATIRLTAGVRGIVQAVRDYLEAIR